MEIKNRFTGAVIHAGDYPTMTACIAGARAVGADLSEANLSEANLSEANLSGADLSEANLSEANLSEANLRGVRHLCPTAVLLAWWGDVSLALCRDLMRYDAANCPGGVKKFTVWARGGPCPYLDGVVSRVANFYEVRQLWKSGKPQTALQLMIRLLREKCANSDWHASASKE